MTTDSRDGVLREMRAAGSTAEGLAGQITELAVALRSQYAAAGMVCTVEDVVFIAATSTDPVVGTSDVYIPAFAARDFAGTLPGLARRLILAGFDRVVVRLPPGQRRIAGLGHTFSRYYWKHPQVGALPSLAEGYALRTSLRAEDVAYVRNRLMHALHVGYTDAGVSGIAEPGHVVDEIIANAGHDGFAAVVTYSGAPVGHITWTSDSEDDVDGRRWLEVIDVLVDPGHEGKGLTSVLMARVERQAASLDMPLLGEVTLRRGSEDDPVEAVLLRNGWHAAYELVAITGADVEPTRG